MGFETRILTEPTQIEEVAGPWRRFCELQPQPRMEQHPEWLAAHTHSPAAGDRKPMVAVLYGPEGVAGVAPFLLRRWSLQCRLGYFTLARFPMLMATLCGTDLLAPQDADAREALLRGVAEADVRYHVIRLEGIAPDSPLLRLVKESPAMARRFWIQSPRAATPRRWVRLAPSFEEYVGAFGRRTRQKLRNLVKRLEGVCDAELRLVRLTRRDQVPEFLAHAERVSALSWQGSRLGQVIRATEQRLDRLGCLADAGWFRSYLLMLGDRAIAFVLGYQADGVYHYDRIGYDPEWADYSPGRTLLYLLLQDLHAADPPEWLDFGSGDSEYKQLFSNHAYDEISVSLIRRSLYTGLAFGVHRATTRTSGGARRLLERFEVRRRVRRLLRGQATRGAPAAGEGRSGQGASDAKESLEGQGAPAARERHPERSRSAPAPVEGMEGSKAT